MIGCLWLLACAADPPRPPIEPVVVVPPVPEPPSVLERGAAVYASARCASCHGEAGEGLRGAFPPLARRDLGACDRIAAVVVAGLTGDIEVDGLTYNGPMPPHDDLDDADVAAVASLVRSWSDAPPCTPEQVAAARTTATPHFKSLSPR